MIKLIAPLLMASSAEAFAPASLLPSYSLSERTTPPQLIRLGETANAQEIEGIVESSQPTKKYVVVGGGWGGWGAAKSLCERCVSAACVIINYGKQSFEHVMILTSLCFHTVGLKMWKSP